MSLIFFQFNGIPPTIQTQYGSTMVGNFSIEQKGISVAADVAISVVASNEHSNGGAGDQFYVIPTCQLGVE